MIIVLKVFHHLLENEMWYTYGILLSVEQLTLFVLSSWHFWKKCRAVKIRADAFRAVDPDSSFRKTFLQLSSKLSLASAGKFIFLLSDEVILFRLKKLTLIVSYHLCYLPYFFSVFICLQFISLSVSLSCPSNWSRKQLEFVCGRSTIEITNL